MTDTTQPNKEPFTPEQTAAMQNLWANDPKIQAQMAAMKAENDQLFKAQGDRPGIMLTAPSQYENQAGVTPPAYEGTRDVRTGELLDQYKQDPYKGDALQALKGQAFSSGLSPWAQVQMSQQKQEQGNAADAASKNQMQAQSGAQTQMARQGGLTGGAAALLARGGQRDLMNAQQGVSNAGASQRLGIQSADAQNKNALLGKFGDMENQANTANIAAATGDINRLGIFNANRYNAQMQAWGADKSASAQVSASRGGGKK